MAFHSLVSANGLVDTAGDQTFFVAGVAVGGGEWLPDYIVAFQVQTAFDFFGC
jgi:hypothetical protein